MIFEESKIIIPVGLVWAGWTFYKIIVEPELNKAREIQTKNHDEMKTQLNKQTENISKIMQSIAQQRATQLPRNVPAVSSPLPQTTQQQITAQQQAQARPAPIASTGKPGEFKLVRPNKRLVDLIALTKEKPQIKQVIDFLKNKKKYEAQEAKIPRGVILRGSASCGKGLIASVIAGEADLPLLVASDSQYDKLGVGPARIKGLFKVAAENKPCIIYLNDLYGIGCERNNIPQNVAARGPTIKQLVHEIDNSENIFVVVGTKRISGSTR